MNQILTGGEAAVALQQAVETLLAVRSALTIQIASAHSPVPLLVLDVAPDHAIAHWFAMRDDAHRRSLSTQWRFRHWPSQTPAHVGILNVASADPPLSFCVAFDLVVGHACLEMMVRAGCVAFTVPNATGAANLSALRLASAGASDIRDALMRATGIAPEVSP